MAASPAGWYPADSRPGQERWWDGHNWTDAYRPVQQVVDQSARAAADWYPATQRPGEERFWTGTEWTDAFRPIQPTAPTPTPSTGGASVDNAPAFLVIALPFVSLGLSVSLLMGGVAVDDTVVTLLLLIATWVTIAWDQRLLKARGIEVSSAWGLLLVPLYLFMRSRAARISYAVPVAWIVVFVGYLVASTAVGNHYGPFTLDMPRIESSIKSQIDGAVSTDSTVSCPSDDTYVLGATFDCTVSDATGTLTERVTVHAGAYVTWAPVAGSDS